MVLVNINGKELYIDGFMQKNLDFVIGQVKKRNEMHIGIIDGRPGTGKSTLGDQLAYYCSDGNHILQDKGFTVPMFSDILNKHEKGAINNNKILDEAFEINRRTSQSSANMRILKQLQRVRSKNPFIWIILPSVFDLDKNIILHLAHIFIHCYAEYDFGPKGRYGVYTRDSLKKLWLYGRESLSYSPKIAKPAFRGRFNSKFYSGDYDIYERAKNDALDDSDDDKEKKSKFAEQRNLLIVDLKKAGVSVKEIAKKIDVKPTTIYAVCQKFGI